MALTGELSDLSLAELIEFFCNQRKTGRIEVKYPMGPAAFYLQAGAVVHAEIGLLRGIEAVYFSLTQANASFTFNSAVESPTQSINQPWTSVVLEGLRRMDEGVAPPDPFPNQPAPPAFDAQQFEVPLAVESIPEVELIISSSVVKPQPEFVVPPVKVLEVETDPIETAAESEPRVEHVETSLRPEVVAAPPAVSEQPRIESEPKEQPKPSKKVKHQQAPSIDVQPAGILSYHPPKVAPAPQVSPIFAEVDNGRSFSYGPWKLGAIFGAVVLVIAVVAVPWGWYARSKAAKANAEAQSVTTESPQPAVELNSTSGPQASQGQSSNEQASLTNEGSAITTNNVAASGSENKTPQKENRAKPKANETALNSVAQPAPVTANPPAANAQPAANPARKVTVQVTYDENGRVTQASGGDATALRIARQKRFPAGKAGSTTITIPIN